MRYEDLSRLVVELPGTGGLQIHRDIFRDPEVFELEMKHVFEGTWIFLGFAVQAPAPHDFFTTWIGRQPVVVMRDSEGQLKAFYNTCRHKGAQLCHVGRGNARYHVCSYHGWAYDSAGRNVTIKDKQHGGYPPSFEAMDHGLLPLGRFGEYRGLLFGSVRADVPELEEHLGETCRFLDMVLEQSPQGMELVPGELSYVYKGNWKLQLENTLDAYHLTSTHTSFMSIVRARKSSKDDSALKAQDFASFKRPGLVRGNYTFKYGHAMNWGNNPEPQIRPLYTQREELRTRLGDEMTRWMFETRNLTLYPNVRFADNAAVQALVIRPLAVDRTEIRSYCLAPVGESAELREFRIRQFEDFFNATGMATPDDNAVYEDCQAGYAARSVETQQGYFRGATVVRPGDNEHVRQLGVRPETSVSGPFELQDESVYRAGYREWLRLMRAALERTVAA